MKALFSIKSGNEQVVKISFTFEVKDGSTRQKFFYSIPEALYFLRDKKFKTEKIWMELWVSEGSNYCFRKPVSVFLRFLAYTNNL